MPRPSSMALTMLAKLSSVSTMSAASLETSVPVMPMAMPMLAVLSAGASLMPSPVMATMCPLRCSAPTMRSLCSGSTRANTRTSSTIASSSASLMLRSSAPVTSRAPGSKMSSSRAIASAVAGWSPVIITVRMCARLAMATAAFTSARGGSIMPTRPSRTRSSSMLSGSSMSTSVGARLCGSMPSAPPAACASRSPACAAPGRERFVAPRQLGAAVLVERDDLAGLPQVAAFREQDLRRALHEHVQLTGLFAIAMDGRVALALGGEGNLRNAREARQLGLGMPNLRAATISAPSVGSPCTRQRPSLCTSAASLASAAARSVCSDGIATCRTLRRAARPRR